ncbi:hypothetical protein MK805_16110 [Shimazuella sp. AN120528]|uniref:hypothetical protein n=1 Tax=Shimazuella soli TaxID=1892854 RepID=UPI001F1030FE|nr:hypothetical protein [Shimazuella soli]MCH5586465.1 hypothetical protein [Shimazuella soli]
MKESPVRSKQYPRRHAAPTGKISRRPLPSPSAVPNINILKLMNGFVSFRSTVHDLSQSLQRLESMMDHTAKFFTVGRDMRMGKRPFVPQLPKPPVSKDEFKTKDDFKDEDIPIIKLPKMPPPRSPFLRLLQYVDMGKVLNVLQSPFMQNIFTRMFAANPGRVRTNTVKSKPRTVPRTARGRNIRRKRVKP